MQRFRNILLLQDRTPRGRKALDRATDLARRNGAMLTVVEVLEEEVESLPAVRAGGEEIDLRRLLIEDRAAALEKLATPLSEQGVRVQTRVLAGNPFLVVTREVIRNGHDLVLLTTEGNSGLKQHLFGSTTRHLIRKCPCPIWAVHPSRSRRRCCVLAAVDPPDEDPAGDDLDRRILEMGSSLARMYDGELDVVHAWQKMPHSARVPRRVMEQWNAEAHERARERLQALLDEHDLNGLKVRIHLPGGAAGLAVAQVAGDQHSEVVVMGTVSRTGVAGLLVGNTAETVLQYIDASVLAVKPAGFVSPVTA
ncbi:MAG: universal stress protein [Candidatus Krumholzibacteriia bacterium]